MIDPAVQSDGIKHLQKWAARGPASDLTAQIEVLRFAADGMSNQQIAERTGQSLEKVKLRLRGSFRKIGAAPIA